MNLVSHPACISHLYLVSSAQWSYPASGCATGRYSSGSIYIEDPAHLTETGRTRKSGKGRGARDRQGGQIEQNLQDKMFGILEGLEKHSEQSYKRGKGGK